MTIIMMMIMMVVKLLNDTALLNKSSKSHGASLSIRNHTVLPATRHM